MWSSWNAETARLECDEECERDCLPVNEFVSRDWEMAAVQKWGRLKPAFVLEVKVTVSFLASKR